MAGTGNFAEEEPALETGADAGRFRVRFTMPDGAPGSVSLPADCLDHLAAALPHIAALAFEAAQGRRKPQVLRFRAGTRPQPRPGARPEPAGIFS
jgi:hypothetical protein